MKIDRISLYPVSYTPKSGPFKLSGGRVFSSFDGVIVKLDTDEGLVGWGEHASAPAYMTALHSGAIAALVYLRPYLIGQDPTQIGVVKALMDRVMQGHEYAKTAVDLACWDIMGKRAGLPVSTLLGGAYRTEIPILDFIAIDTPEEMANKSERIYAEGYRTVQIKVGAGWRDDVERVRAIYAREDRFDNIIVDANAQWKSSDALQFLRATAGLDYMLEQPCRSLESNLAVRERTDVPMILDESLDCLAAVDAANAKGVFDGAMLKLSRFGGISDLRVARDSCVRWGRFVTMEDMAGGAIVTAAAMALAASTPVGGLLSGSCTGKFMNESYGTSVTYPPETGTAVLSSAPGLGVDVDEPSLGSPLPA